MPLLRRRAFMSQLAPENCDICHEAMTEPTRTACRHFYCFECLESWLTTNNTCPTCRLELFEEPAEDVEEEEDEAPAAAAARASRRSDLDRDMAQIFARLETLETSVARLTGAEIPVPTVGAATGEGEAETVTMDSNAMHRLLGHLMPEQSELPEWYPQVRTRDMLYTLEVRDTTVKLLCLSFDVPQWLERIPDREGSGEVLGAYFDRQHEWGHRVIEYIQEDVDANDFAREARLLIQEEAGNPLERRNFVLQ
ncbi:hypothetical protein CERZMDRAFT_88404 [Cercospora zeae-maydis SCOH1-5]|uniref:RING-type domain-containing protein n=1 Tax=Cercospora zeae-maydis SCOH1-5 TaxID=717836 RepID=A0A6A6F1E3_9PEZI|nr:hypothetical protein CERZMDRAFT_88404 [Cercospora zeae-maydis SCOH1-5]